jgi:hypothetical protein
MGIIAKVRRRKKGEHLRQAEHERWRQAEQGNIIRDSLSKLLSNPKRATGGEFSKSHRTRT